MCVCVWGGGGQNLLKGLRWRGEFILGAQQYAVGEVDIIRLEIQQHTCWRREELFKGLIKYKCHLRMGPG